MHALYDEDEAKTLRKSHENPDLIRLYQDFLGQPLRPPLPPPAPHHLHPQRTV